MIRDVKRAGGRIAFVVGPVVVHTGGGGVFLRSHPARLRGRAARRQRAGRARHRGGALRDVARRQPRRPARRSKGATAITCAPSTRSAAPAGSAPAVESGLLTSGVMYECVRHDVPVRPRGQHPRRRARCPTRSWISWRRRTAMPRRSRTSGIAVVLSTMLHGIGVGNMLPSWVKVVCVDINPSVVTKLVDRGSAQTHGPGHGYRAVRASAGRDKL